MTNKMKGLLKGLRYISQIFDEEKEQEMQIGLPTDVKHVAHIGWDGPTADSPGWMNDLNSSSGLHSAPLGPHGDPKDNSQIKWVSEDSKRSSSQKTTSNNDTSPKKKDPSTKPRQSRKHQSKELNKQDSTMHATTSTSSSSPPRGLPDIPKKTRRKKSKESVNGGGSTRSRTKGTTSSNNGGTTDNSEPAPSIDGDEDQRENRVTLRE
ncbi:hypothetical protein ACP275_14G217100 [Erythranthe tilingii]